MLLIEKNSHFQHLFAFPRFAVTTGVDTHKAFIPYVPGTFASSPADSGRVVQARVTSLSASAIQLDRRIVLDGLHLDSIPYSFLVSSINISEPVLAHESSSNSFQVIATGTKLTPPSTLPGSEKLDGVTYLKQHAERVRRSSAITVIGGGAVGVQMATDIKELYPGKSVTLVHSRKILMNKFHHKLNDIIQERCTAMGITTKLGSRVKLPSEGYPTNGSRFHVELEDGSSIDTDFAVRLPSSSQWVTHANEVYQDNLHRPSAPVKPSSIPFSRVYSSRRLHSNNENLADQRCSIPKYFCNRRCRRNGSTQSS